MTPSDTSYREIPLTKGKVALVDAADYEWMSQYNWTAKLDRESGNYYAQRAVWLGDGRTTTMLMHRELLGLKRGDPRQGDHENHDTLDNRRSVNLRIATRSQNMHNRVINRNNKSGYKGVIYEKDRRKYLAYFGLNGKMTKVGRYDSAEDAFHARREAIAKAHGDFARIG